ncbi:YkvA family protein [Snodgrassella sp. CFCC 13594]|uniref:YkvA family protein n=1 Tax=Snodgrassella sp. CFCC 13594 TaxID=1775559 RepID=UPI000829B359|nr:YkvA family protein [Snodgrassella sp. CFCC 13594]
MTDANKLQQIQEKFRRRRLDERGFLAKLKKYAGKIGKPAAKQLYALYFLLKSKSTPTRSKLIIVGALVYFLSPIDSIPDLMGPLGFSDDLAVIALVYAQLKNLLTDDIVQQAKTAADKLFGE